MRVSILGPLEVEADSGALEIGGLRVRALLAVLALEAGRPVTAERLIDLLWAEKPPANAANALQTLVKRLRAGLRPHAAVESRAGGYLLTVDPERVDAHRFARLAKEGAADQALGLWRGPALADLTAVPYLAGVAARLEEERLTTVEAGAAKRLARGEPVDLSEAVAANPLRERLCALAVRSLAA
ncbi:AfsR/SARP family transcriptional regulator, partial [Streptomyces anulatus]|uniref:AfsR/SARP family transcriptional regulator n=1 Tax=Streptomyces anulatus TaxID=1892 RepID=UPI0034136979